MLELEFDEETVKPTLLFESEMVDYLVLKGHAMKELTCYCHSRKVMDYDSDKIAEIAKDIGYEVSTLIGYDTQRKLIDAMPIGNGRVYTLKGPLIQQLHRLEARHLEAFRMLLECKDCEKPEKCLMHCEKLFVCTCGCCKLLTQEDECIKNVF